MGTGSKKNHKGVNWRKDTRREVKDTLLIIIITLFPEDNIFGTNVSLTYGSQICHAAKSEHFGSEKSTCTCNNSN